MYITWVDITPVMTTLSIGNYSLILFGALTAASALFVLIKNPKSDPHRSFFMFALGGAAWISGIGLLSLTRNFAFDRFVNLGGLVFVTGFFLVARSIPVPMAFNINRLFLWVPAIIDLFIIFKGDLINTGMIIGTNGVLIPMPGAFSVAQALLNLGYTFFGILILGYKFKNSTGKEKLRIKYLFLATTLFMTISVVCDSLLPAFGISQYNLLGPLSSILFIGLTAYAILRHELMDIRIVIQRGLIYTILFALTVACYLLIINFLGLFVGKDSDLIILITSIFTTILGIATLPFIERSFRKITDSFFFKDKYDYADALRELSAIVYTTIEFDELILGIEKTLQKIFKNESVKLDVTNREQHIVAKHDHKKRSLLATLQIPIELGGNEIGTIFCGRKRSGDDYTKEDVKLLETFVYQAATALSRAKLNREIKQYAETLESKVEKRTEDLRLAQEHQKQMMIDISHNLQTPLAVFQTKIEQLKKSLKADPAVANFEQSLKDLSSFIYSLLSLAKLENRAEPGSVSEINVSDLISDIAEEIDIIAEDRGIHLTSTITPNIAVVGSQKELREAVLNLASNAIKYMGPTGKKEIAIKLNKNRTSALFSIADSGVGIAEADAKRLFERFYRVKKPGNSIGTGLGLAITRQIINHHGGKIWCESREGIGTTFFIELPLAGTANAREYTIPEQE